MKKALIIIAVIFGVFLFTGGIFVVSYFSILNTQVEKKNNVEAKQQVCMSYRDKMFAEIKEVASVPEAAKEAFKEIYIPLMEGRYGGEKGSPLMKFVHEQNPQFDLSLYSKLMNVISTNRAEFQIQQEQLIDLKRDYDTYVKMRPQTWLLSDTEPIKIVIIKTQNTEDAYKTGISEEIDVFGKKAKAKKDSL